MMRNLLAILSVALGVAACTDRTPTSSQPRAVTINAGVSANGNNMRIPFELAPPVGSPFPDAAATGFVYGAFLDGSHPRWEPGLGLDIRMHGVPCPTWGWGSSSADIAVSSRLFYAVYAQTTSNGRIRLMSFTPNCLGDNETVRAPLPNDLDWMSETITIEIVREGDDGDDAGPVVLRGTASASP